MPRLTLRALRALLPAYPVSIATTPTQAEATALARLLVSQGRRAVILPAAAGYLVQEVRS
ncbi:hypothetical protein PWG14_18530 (plasmid) [Chromobacterium amazonense]|uniref:hypothetical protein n=1 Tax=Chromobacterium amazonense TaxID=1382803 RepID=UPI00237E6EE6|nr:hypothetical protein [Chromobacterium amazonense]MDE1714504.1 hypothetical protein [Chromobacterium amazonense]